MKVIYLSGKSLGSSDKYYPVGSDEFYLFGIGQFIAHDLINRGYDIQPELWRVDNGVNDIQEKDINGIKCRIYPGDNFFSKETQFSVKMALDLHTEAKKDKKTVFHFTNTHILRFEIYSMFIGKKRIIASHLGNANPLWRYRKKKKIKYLLAYYLEKLTKKNYKKIYTICKEEMSYYRNIKLPVKYSIIYGVCREDNFVIKQKDLCRDKLGLPKDKKIILQVGRAVKYRGFEWILNLLDEYENNTEYLFLFVGVNKTDECYDELSKKKCIIIEHTDHRKLVDYYNSADLFIFFIVGEKYLTFGGTGYVPLEALLCGIPTIATSLHHIENSELRQYAKIPKKENDVYLMMDELMKCDYKREESREYIKNLFSWEKISESYWSDYIKK